MVTKTFKDFNKVKNPDHYTKGKIEPWDFIAANNLNFFEGNIVKYITRYKYKNGLEDLYKVREYVEKLIDLEKK